MSAPGGGCLVETPGRLLLRAVRILLECIRIRLIVNNNKLVVPPIHLDILICMRPSKVM